MPPGRRRAPPRVKPAAHSRHSGPPTAFRWAQARHPTPSTIRGASDTRAQVTAPHRSNALVHTPTRDDYLARPIAPTPTTKSVYSGGGPGRKGTMARDVQVARERQP